MRTLVTGASGMLGRQLLERIAASNEVTALGRSNPSQPAEPEIHWVRQDLTEPLDRSQLPDKVDAVIHLAQSRRYRDLPDGAEDLFEVNVHSTFRLLQYAREAEAQRFVLASTGGVYELSPDPIREDGRLAMPGPYFRSKGIAELLLQDYARYFHGVALRFFFVYGPGRGQTLVSRLADSILAGEEVVIEGNPGMRFNPIFVSDAARAVEAALGVDESTTINVAGEQVVSVTELAERLARALDREPIVRHSGEGPAGDLVADTALMKARLGVEATTVLDEGLDAVARSFAVS